MLWLLAVITFASCTASRKVEQGSSEQQRDSVVSIVMDSVAKSEARTDSSAVTVTDESHTSGTTSEKGRGEETVQERVTESTDAQGNKTTTTDRTIHRKGDYERNSSYEEHFKHLESTISRMQHTIDSLVLSNRLDVGTHWAKNDSTGVVKEKITKDVYGESAFGFLFNAAKNIVFWLFILWYFFAFISWLKDKTEKWLKSQSSRK